MTMTNMSSQAQGFVAGVKETASDVSSAFATGGKAYAGGLLEVGRTLGGFGREVVAEAARHAKATVSARSLREVAELQAAFVQNRLEVSTAHAKELADLARARSEQVIAPFTALLKQDEAA